MDVRDCCKYEGLWQCVYAQMRTIEGERSIGTRREGKSAGSTIMLWWGWRSLGDNYFEQGSCAKSFWHGWNRGKEVARHIACDDDRFKNGMRNESYTVDVDYYLNRYVCTLLLRGTDASIWSWREEGLGREDLFTSWIFHGIVHHRGRLLGDKSCLDYLYLYSLACKLAYSWQLCSNAYGLYDNLL